MLSASSGVSVCSVIQLPACNRIWFCCQRNTLGAPEAPVGDTPADPPSSVIAAGVCGLCLVGGTVLGRM